jgi:hypothetical protein
MCYNQGTIRRWSCAMVLRGFVRNGVVVLDEGVRLPEGEEVTVVAGPSISRGQSDASHSVMDIPAVSLGGILERSEGDEDLLGEMLEDRK